MKFFKTVLFTSLFLFLGLNAFNQIVDPGFELPFDGIYQTRPIAFLNGQEKSFPLTRLGINRRTNEVFVLMDNNNTRTLDDEEIEIYNGNFQLHGVYWLMQEADSFVFYHMFSFVRQDKSYRWLVRSSEGDEILIFLDLVNRTSY